MKKKEIIEKLNEIEKLLAEVKELIEGNDSQSEQTVPPNPPPPPGGGGGGG